MNKLPIFFIVDAAKAGITALYYYLGQPPQSFLPKFKEPHFFSWIDYQASLGEFSFVENFDDYARLFRKVEELSAIGETSVSFLSYSGTARRTLLW